MVLFLHEESNGVAHMPQQIKSWLLFFRVSSLSPLSPSSCRADCANEERNVQNKASGGERRIGDENKIASKYNTSYNICTQYVTSMQRWHENLSSTFHTLEGTDRPTVDKDARGIRLHWCFIKMSWCQHRWQPQRIGNCM